MGKAKTTSYSLHRPMPFCFASMHPGRRKIPKPPRTRRQLPGQCGEGCKDKVLDRVVGLEQSQPKLLQRPTWLTCNCDPFSYLFKVSPLLQMPPGFLSSPSRTSLPLIRTGPPYLIQSVAAEAKDGLFVPMSSLACRLSPVACRSSSSERLHVVSTFPRNLTLLWGGRLLTDPPQQSPAYGCPV